MPKHVETTLILQDEKKEQKHLPIVATVKQEDNEIDWDEEWWNENIHEIIEMANAYDKDS